MILTPLQKLPKNVVDLGELIVVKGFEKLPKVQLIAKSGHTASCVCFKNLAYILTRLSLLRHQDRRMDGWMQYSLSRLCRGEENISIKRNHKYLKRS